ncbi:hypothetical protein GCM10010327_32100 [Streptomyces nitrosporeus]|nr:hypothetical protein GCM10010327_32100 [Streptomyces nitrosporeus]
MIKKYAPNVPVGTRDLEKVAEKDWTNSMRKMEGQATDAAASGRAAR